MKASKNKVTVLKQSQNSRSVTLTSFVKFTILEGNSRLRHLKSSQKLITFATYWDPMRHAISRAHNSEPANWEELIKTTLLQKGAKLMDFNEVLKNSINMFTSLSIKGVKLKKLKSEIDIEGLTIRLNPELSLLDGEIMHVMKFYYSKHIPMTNLAAQQAIALMDVGFGIPSNVRYYVLDLYRGKAFEASGLQQASLERAVLNSRAYISLVESHIDIQTKSA